jgi:hypothetical protein
MKQAIRGTFLLLTGTLACSSQSDPPAGQAPSSTTTAKAIASPPTATASATATVAAEPAVPSNVPESIEGANATVESTTMDGLEMSKVSCKGGGGMLGALPILGALATKRTLLAACSKAGESVRVHFAFSAGKASDVRVAGASSPAVAKCVADAVSAAPFPEQGSCVLTVKLPSGA